MCINWAAVSAIGTVSAAIVGVAGIIINLCEKRKRLIVRLEMFPETSLIISNASTRAVTLMKMVCSCGDHVIHVEYYTGLKQKVIDPAAIDMIVIDTRSIIKVLKGSDFQAICKSSDRIIIKLYDNYGRKYVKKTDITFERLNRYGYTKSD